MTYLPRVAGEHWDIRRAHGGNGKWVAYIDPLGRWRTHNQAEYEATSRNEEESCEYGSVVRGVTPSFHLPCPILGDALEELEQEFGSK